ncbi:MAG: insulinase family protein [Gemmatimonadetes bacterium]|nr:insulinase family protein [Gemmatimonadota bacterium]
MRAANVASGAAEAAVGVAAEVANVVEAAGDRVVTATAELTGLRRTIFPNGLTVVSEYMPHVRSVALGAWVRSASVHEVRADMGVSHMLEHLVFKGTERRGPREIALALESLGGSLDAWTSREHTSFQARVLDEHLPQAADVLADLLFAPTLRARDLDLERKVVLEEISMVEDAPDDIVFELHNAMMWGEHPLGYSILGTRDTVSGLHVDTVRALHDRAYRPEHIVLSAAGHVEHDALLDALVATGWDRVPRGDAQRAVMPAAAGPARGQRQHVDRDVAQSHVVLGAGAISYSDPRRYVFALLASVLGGGMSSRLFQRVREERGLAYSIYAFHQHYRDAGMHGVYFATSPEQVDEAIGAVRAELGDLVAHGLPAAELAIGKGQLKGQMTLSLESPGSRLYRAAATELYGEPFRSLDQVLAEIEAITEADVASLAVEMFRPDDLSILTLGPSGAS